MKKLIWHGWLSLECVKKASIWPSCASQVSSYSTRQDLMSRKLDLKWSVLSPSFSWGMQSNNVWGLQSANLVLGHWDRIWILLLSCPSHCPNISLPESVKVVVLISPKLIMLWDFNILYVLRPPHQEYLGILQQSGTVSANIWSYIHSGAYSYFDFFLAMMTVKYSLWNLEELCYWQFINEQL